MLRSVVWCFIFAASCLCPVSSAMAAGPMPVVVSIVPQSYFVRQIGGDLVDVQVMVQPGASPATYEPKPGQMAALANARLYFSVGVPFETIWLKKIAASNPDLVIVRTDEGIKKRLMTAGHTHENDNHHMPATQASGHGSDAGMNHESESDPAGSDPHIWLSPPLVKQQCIKIRDALSLADPRNTDTYRKNFDDFSVRLDNLDTRLKASFAGYQGKQIMVFHPSWGYFADAYGFTQIPVEIEGKDPKPSQLKWLIEHAREKGITAIFVQPQFSVKSARLIAREIRGRAVVADPLAGDWLANLEGIAARFRETLK